MSQAVSRDLCVSVSRAMPDVNFQTLRSGGSCRISPPRFLAECRMRRLNQASFVLLYFALFVFLGCR